MGGGPISRKKHYVTLEWPLGDEIECFVGKTVVIVVRGSDTCSVFCPGFQKGRVPSEKSTFSAVNGPSKGHN